MTKIIGIIPARMGSSRFPGKPLHAICGMPMIEHVYRRASQFSDWHELVFSTCDDEIAAFVRSIGAPVIRTASTHERALDRVAETAEKLGYVDDNDIVINVQGDEPMMQSAMIAELVKPILHEQDVNASLLAMPIIDEKQFFDPNILKIVHNLKGDILYTSRASIPHCEKFTADLNVHRIYGLFAFRYHLLKTFTQLKPSPLELNEACDSNRLYDYGYTQRMVSFPYVDSFSVDTPEDLQKVELYMAQDPTYKTYQETV